MLHSATPAPDSKNFVAARLAGTQLPEDVVLKEEVMVNTIQIHTTAVLGVDVAVKDAVPDLHIPAALESQHGVRLASVRCTESQAIDPDMTNSKVSIATLARTAALAFALANQVSSAAGKPLLPIESSEVEQVRDHRPDHCHQRCCMVEEQQFYRRRHRR